MKDKFPGYYRPSEEEFAILWKECIFALDANVLLNLYRYPQTARDELLKIISRDPERFWIPHQAALEFQRNRLSVIAEQKNKFREVRKIV
ncbi:MAG: PIN-like domain-containing protein, partial [Hyphomicrobium sp.]